MVLHIFSGEVETNMSLSLPEAIYLVQSIRWVCEEWNDSIPPYFCRDDDEGDLVETFTDRDSAEAGCAELEREKQAEENPFYYCEKLTDLTQLEHLLQTSEAIRRDGHPRWMVATGFVHDLGKCLCLYGEPQWGVVGDTFPTGCAYSDAVVFPEYFCANADYQNPLYQTKFGIYEENCGLDKVKMSFGHDGYIYEVMKNYLPMESLYMLRYHSFYAWHRHGAYDYLCNEQDRAMLPWVLKFNPYDLYSKGHTKPDLKQLKPYYDDLFAEFFPEKIAW